MSDASEVQAPKGKRKIGCLTQLIIAVVLFVLIVVGGALAWNAVASRRLNAAVTAMKNAGYATSAEELEAAYGPMVEPNPGPLWVEAGKNFVADNAADTKRLPFIGAEEDIEPGSSFTEIDNARKYIARHARDFDLVRRAAKNPNPPRYGPLVVTNPTEIKLDFVQGHRHISRVLGLRAIVQSHDKDMDGLLETLKQNLHVGPSLMDETTIMAQFVADACTQMSLADVEKYAGQDFTDQQLASLQTALRNIDVFKSLRRGLEGEVVHGLSFFQNPMVRGPIPRYDDSAFMAEQALLLLEASKSKDWKQVNEAARELEELIAESQKTATGAARYMMAMTTLPAYAALCNAELRVAAGIAVHETLIATRRFQLKHQRLPEKLEDLVPDFLPAVPTDPYSNASESLIFKVEDGNVLIYSRGFNGDDDDGNREVDPTGNGYLDIVAELKTN